MQKVCNASQTRQTKFETVAGESTMREKIIVNHTTPNGKIVKGIGLLNVTIRDSNNTPVQYAVILNGEYIVIPACNARRYVQQSTPSQYAIGGFIQTKESCSCNQFQQMLDCEHLLTIRKVENDESQISNHFR